MQDELDTLTRREFMRMSALGAVGLVLTSCSKKPENSKAETPVVTFQKWDNIPWLYQRGYGQVVKPALQELTESKFAIDGLKIAHDGNLVYTLLHVTPGVIEKFEKFHTTGYIGQILFDSDNNQMTGHRTAPYQGVDYFAKITTGVFGSEPSVSCEVKDHQENRVLIHDYITMRSMPGFDNRSEFLKFDKSYVEIVMPMAALGIRPETYINIYVSEFATELATKTQGYVQQTQAGALTPIIAVQ